MSWKDIFKPWPCEPAGCPCAQRTAATLAETLRCAAPWGRLPDGRWAHASWSAP